MQKNLFALMALCLAPWTASPGGAPDDEAVLRELKQVLWPKAYREQDVVLLDGILADEFQMIDSDGHWSTKADELEWISNNEVSYDSLDFRVRRLEIFENGTAIVAGTGIIRGLGTDGPYVAEYQSTNILLKRAGKWRAVASHVSGFRQR